MVRRRLRVVVLLPLVLLLTGCAIQRPADPVVLTGADTPRLAGVALAKLLAFHYLNDKWEQIPVQVDERAVIDLAKPKNAAATGKTFLAYTDPNTFTGPDPDANLDANDEIAFMGQDAGFQAPAGSSPANVVAGTGSEIKIVDPVGDPTPAYVYLFRQTGSLSPGAGRDYVDYQFNLLSGDYKSTYKIASGPNPENSTVTTPFYAQHFSDRWVDDQLKITAKNASGVDILDRHKDQFAPGSCVRTEDTFSAGAGAMIANKNGPVRAIRSYLGANSGTYTQRDHIFYQRRQDLTTYLRVHAIPGVIDWFDYTPAASGMIYRNNNAAGGVRIDGTRDSVPPGPLTWESVDGTQGSLTIVHTSSTDIPNFSSSSYYLDTTSPTGSAEVQCTGDGVVFGGSGPWVNVGIPNTDPTLGAANKLTVTRTLFYDSPGRANGAQAADGMARPMQTTVAAWP
jgi:hypothetical protein